MIYVYFLIKLGQINKRYETLIKHNFIKYSKSIKIDFEQIQYYLISEPPITFKYDNFMSEI
jgi:hypothetical protein